MIAASAPRSSAARKSTIEWPPVSSSPSQQNRTFTGSSPAAAELARRREQHVELSLVVDASRDRRGTRRGSPARTGRCPTARAASAAERRSGRSRAPSALPAPPEAAISPIASGCPSQSTTSPSPPAARMKSRTQSAARSTRRRARGRRSPTGYAGTRRARRTRVGHRAPESSRATIAQLLGFGQARSFFSDWFSICRMRSRVTLNVAPDLVERARVLAAEPVAELEHAALAVARAC